MNGLAFLVMLGSFALVLGWYAFNHERDRDGRDGLLGVRTGEDEADTETTVHTARPEPTALLEVGGDPVARVRAKAARGQRERKAARR